MTVTLRYFAMLREQAGRDAESRTTPAATAAALYQELAQAYHFDLPPTALRVAVNGAIVALDTALHDGDEVTFLPPVAGG